MPRAIHFHRSEPLFAVKQRDFEYAVVPFPRRLTAGGKQREEAVVNPAIPIDTRCDQLAGLLK